MKVPPFLKSGDCVGVAATARWVTREQLQMAIHLFESWGLRVKVAPNVHEENFQLAGTAEQRTEGLQHLLDDEDVQAVIIARGGYGTIHTVDALDFSRFLEKPKWVAGYSDITVLHAHLNSRDVATIHSTMPISFPDATPEAIENLRQCLFGEFNTFASLVTADQEFSAVNGYLMGGNLSVLYSLLGSDSWLQRENVILFIEDVDEMLYHLDRMLWGFYRSGILSNVNAIVCGGFTQMKDNTMQFGFLTDNPWGADSVAIIHSLADRLQIPVAFGFPAGHLSDNRAFYLGRNVVLNCNLGKAEINY